MHQMNPTTHEFIHVMRHSRHNGGEGGGQKLCHYLAAGAPREDLYLPRGVQQDVLEGRVTQLF